MSRTYPAASHASRTLAQLYSLLPSAEKSKPQILLLAGEITPFRNDTDRELPFRQESNFFYLTGCDVPGSYALVTPFSIPQLGLANGNGILHQQVNGSGPLDYSTTRSYSYLFIPKAELADIMWSIPPPPVEDATKMYDVTQVEYIASLESTIESILQSYPDALFHTLPRGSPLFPSLNSSYVDTILNKEGSITDAYLLPSLHHTRLIKDKEEIELIREANRISSRAHEVVMRVLGKATKGLIHREDGAGVSRPLLPGEWSIEKESEAEAIFVASCRREGAVHQAYLPIVASSQHAATLHYCCNDKEFAWGPVSSHNHTHDYALRTPHIHPQVLLIDAGSEFSCYASDITRTMPVGNGGKFTPEARAIYSLVLKMQQSAMAIMKPGVHWDKVHLLTHKVLVEGFLELGLFKDGSVGEILKSGISAPFYPHGLGHSMGMDVHDVPSTSKPVVNKTIPQDLEGHESFYTYLRLRLPLEVGMVVTVEPGIYFHEHLLAPILAPTGGSISPYLNLPVLEKYLGMGGVRIEDDVLITETGCENLTTVGSEVAWVEGVCSGDL